MCAAITAQDPTEPVRYDRDIRPILSDRCFTCHGPDPGQRKADLRLDSFEHATAHLDEAVPIVPGEPARSEVWRRLTDPDPDERMPPKDSGKKALDDHERELIRRWIAGGAEYEPHWSFQVPRRPELPDGPAAETPHPIDRFLRARLLARGADLSPPADHATVVRRLFLSLTGLPPTPAELAEPIAVEQWIDRLLDHEPYRSRHAEHLATPWLDAARYADTNGIHMDNSRQAWSYRDYVLRSLRDNKPFDRFVVEQLAGDLLPDATLEQQIASGFHRNQIITDEGGAISEEYLVEYAVDRVATTGSVFLGLTLACARCHEHKYDPVSQEDFYRFFAFFNSVDQPGLYSQTPDQPQRAFEPFVVAPSEQQAAARSALQERIGAAEAALAAADPAEVGQIAAFEAVLREQHGLAWHDSKVVAATATGSELAIEADGSVFTGGANPARDDHRITLETTATDLRLLCLHALADPRLPAGRVGRAPNGNAVLSHVELLVESIADPAQSETVALIWAWADVEQQNGDYRVVNALEPDGRGWAVDAHNVPGDRTALFLSARPFGYAGGSRITATLRYQSRYAEHTFGRVRLSLGALAETGIERLPDATSGHYLAGPFALPSGDAYQATHGPAAVTAISPQQKFEDGKRWQFQQGFRDANVNKLPGGASVVYVGQHVFAPSPRRHRLALGSDDGFRLFVGGNLVAEKRIDRAAAPDQDSAEADFAAGRTAIVQQVVNTGGDGGSYVRRVPREQELQGDLVLALLPPTTRAGREAQLATAWRLQFSPGYRQRRDALTALQQELTALEATMPRAMVMRELAQPRPTYLLMRGEYDKPDRNRPIAPGIPAALGALPEGAPQNRLGLAQWMVAPDNPLLARVTVNRLWELLFGTGLVATSEDFGMQGDYPSHPELLDWLAVELRESGWDLRHMLRLLVSSRAFQQSDVAVPVRGDPQHRLLGHFPRRRLPAEVVRDQALYAGNLLVERFGGSSVKPVQPEGLWQEVAMVQSNTRIFEASKDDGRWRRSVYTFWKRASPPPNLMLFDAPTREYCAVRRLTTNTPLQALVLWNDAQFVEAARALAQAVHGKGDDEARIREMFLRCTARQAGDSEMAAFTALLERGRERYAADAAAAEALSAVGSAPRDASIAAGELAAWTLLANAMLTLDATICIR